MLDELFHFLELFEWSKMTIAEKSGIVRNLGLLLSAIIGVFFLAWRAISNDRIARAALKQAQIATGQLQIANNNLELQTKQVEAANKQVLILSKNADLSTRSFQETVENNSFSHFYAALTGLAEAENELHRLIAMIIVGEAAKTNERFLSPALNAFSNYARTVSPSSDLGIEQYNILPQVDSDDTETILEALKRFPLAFWLEVKPSLGHLNAYDFMQSLDDTKDKITEEQENIIKLLWHFIQNLHPASISHFWYEKICKAEIRALINVLGDLKHTYPGWPIPLSNIKLDGCDFSVRNFSHAQFTSSSLRGAKCFRTDFSNIIAVGCDFQSAWLTEANFSNANVIHCDFNGCALEGAIFTGADVSGCRFTNCLDFDESRLRDAKNVHEAIIQ
ncbi:MAG: pentapeptide repeat-containing protein [Candidatus Thiodiazotropha sp. (ex Clathrolucina costata)]|nr:pentapeptide repeat-containing protein [Candidatus Thiodiazotropha taylori]MCG7860937.1 pentapeptide repeat-containing protein [Candidatus Thiodiazotropha endolucinida]